MRAVGYMLLSGRHDDPVCDDEDYCSQRPPMLKMARRLGARLERIPCDRTAAVVQGLSHRTCLAEVLSMIKDSSRRTVIIYSLQSLQLSEIEAALLVQSFSKRSVEIWEATTGVNLTADVDRWRRIVWASKSDFRIT